MADWKGSYFQSDIHFLSFLQHQITCAFILFLCCRHYKNWYGLLILSLGNPHLSFFCHASLKIIYMKMNTFFVSSFILHLFLLLNFLEYSFFYKSCKRHMWLYIKPPPYTMAPGNMKPPFIFIPLIVSKFVFQKTYLYTIIWKLYILEIQPNRTHLWAIWLTVFSWYWGFFIILIYIDFIKHGLYIYIYIYVHT